MLIFGLLFLEADQIFMFSLDYQVQNVILAFITKK